MDEEGAVCSRSRSGETRKALTSLLAAALQSFADAYVFHPTERIEPIARMIGNAVPPRLASFLSGYLARSMAGQSEIVCATKSGRHATSGWRARKDSWHAARGARLTIQSRRCAPRNRFHSETTERDVRIEAKLMKWHRDDNVSRPIAMRAIGGRHTASASLIQQKASASRSSDVRTVAMPSPAAPGICRSCVATLLAISRSLFPDLSLLSLLSL